MKHLIFSIFVLLSLLTYGQSADNSYNSQFVVVIDPGHGGKDPGNMGNGHKEKDIALKVGLKVGDLLKKDKDIKVIYTRTTDKFISLAGRAKIANDAKADLFISIHLNSFRTSSPHGTETFVLGTHRNKDNLDIAIKENSVIYLEEDHEETYNGFDPTDPASYIGMTLMQEEYLDQSIVLADYIQKKYTKKLRRTDRGVKKAGFLVLRETYMPSVLTELGFLTNKAEGRYLNSKKGQEDMAYSLTEGILKYKKALNLHESEKQADFNDKSEESLATADILFRVQIGVGSTPLETAPYNFKGLEGVERLKEGEFYKYYFGRSSDYLKIQDINREAKKQGFPEAFIVAFENGEKISIETALKSKAN